MIGWIGIASVFGNIITQLLLAFFQFVKKHKSKLHYVTVINDILFDLTIIYRNQDFFNKHQLNSLRFEHGYYH